MICFIILKEPQQFLSSAWRPVDLGSPSLCCVVAQNLQWPPCFEIPQLSNEPTAEVSRPLGVEREDIQVQVNERTGSEIELSS